jgi:hypothetical protein
MKSDKKSDKKKKGVAPNVDIAADSSSLQAIESSTDKGILYPLLLTRS